MRRFFLKKLLLAMLSCSLVFFAGCGVDISIIDNPNSTQVTDAPVVQSVPPVPPTPDEFDVLKSELYNAFTDAFKGDIFLINNYSLSMGYDDAKAVIASIVRYTLKHDLLTELLHDCAIAASEHAAALTNNISATPMIDIETPSWQYLAAVLPMVSSAEEFISVLSPRFEIYEHIGMLDELKISIEPLSIFDFAVAKAEECGDADQAANIYIDIRFTYAYLTAIYDETGEERADAVSFKYIYPAGYLDSLCSPLEECPSFIDTWAQGRSNNTRKHMGTDLKIAEGTPILSCGDGIVLYTGTAAIPGNYVLVIDELGFEYHYYHMCEPTKQVKKGDAVTQGQHIGNVGNTGNSDTAHLHISIIAPDGMFINPYELVQYVARSNG